MTTRHKNTKKKNPRELVVVEQKKHKDYIEDHTTYRTPRCGEARDINANGDKHLKKWSRDGGREERERRGYHKCDIKTTIKKFPQKTYRFLLCNFAEHNFVGCRIECFANYISTTVGSV